MTVELSSLNSPPPETEELRLRALEGTRVLDRGTEYRFDRLTRLCAQLFKVPIAFIAFVGRDLNYMKAATGLPVVGPSNRDFSFSNHIIQRSELFVIEDARADPRFRDLPQVVGDPFVRFVAGFPIEVQRQRVGVLVLMDNQPRTFSEMEGSILHDLAKWVQYELQNDEERSRATAVHRALLPVTLPKIDGYEVAGRCVPSQAVGGDFYDWYLTRGDQLVVTVADVMGKGMGAAMVMATVRTVLKLIARRPVLADALQEAAHVLDDDLNRTQSFVTLFDARITPSTGEVEYVDAGLGLAIIVSSDGSFERLQIRGLPLGIQDDAVWESGYALLSPGDTLVIFSDGIYDELGGTDESIVQIAAAMSVAGVEQGIQALIDTLGGRQAIDDVTIIAVRRLAES